MHATYFIIARESGKVKIGQCREPKPPAKRLKALQTGCPEYLEVLLVLTHKAPFEELQLHHRFSQYRKHGEWFDYRGELKAFIDRKRVDPRPTPEDDLRSLNGCIPELTSVSDPPVLGSGRDEKSYGLYVKYCETVSCTPAPYPKWLKISDNPVEYEKLTDAVEPRQPSHVSEPYARWESAW